MYCSFVDNMERRESSSSVRNYSISERKRGESKSVYERMIERNKKESRISLIQSTIAFQNSLSVHKTNRIV